ncbi:uncharacterized protein ARMOST_06090 [Armillaria ostoyae]|uniref:Uncharacterized protein n=1 Tax=Armillaria ostoyae TaxID=47428 RepID=A0A284R201_ARMOS|nr:uncharacterized protein ARMOST_06090 [Armillaria ostoyae]
MFSSRPYTQAKTSLDSFGSIILRLSPASKRPSAQFVISAPAVHLSLTRYPRGEVGHGLAEDPDMEADRISEDFRALQREARLEKYQVSTLMGDGVLFVDNGTVAVTVNVGCQIAEERTRGESYHNHKPPGELHFFRSYLTTYHGRIAEGVDFTIIGVAGAGVGDGLWTNPEET